MEVVFTVFFVAVLIYAFVMCDKEPEEIPASEKKATKKKKK